MKFNEMYSREILGLCEIAIKDYDNMQKKVSKLRQLNYKANIRINKEELISLTYNTLNKDIKKWYDFWKNKEFDDFINSLSNNTIYKYYPISRRLDNEDEIEFYKQSFIEIKEKMSTLKLEELQEYMDSFIKLCNITNEIINNYDSKKIDKYKKTIEKQIQILEKNVIDDILITYKKRIESLIMTGKKYNGTLKEEYQYELEKIILQTYLREKGNCEDILNFKPNTYITKLNNDEIKKLINDSNISSIILAVLIIIFAICLIPMSKTWALIVSILGLILLISHLKPIPKINEELEAYNGVYTFPDWINDTKYYIIEIYSCGKIQKIPIVQNKVKKTLTLGEEVRIVKIKNYSYILDDEQEENITQNK